jgi:uncharacterized protein YndB with AHSA1/START domain
MKITVERTIKNNLQKVWTAWNQPEDIKRWNAASDDWHTTASSVDLRPGGKFTSRMEAKDGSAGFDFEGVFSRVEEGKRIVYAMADGREVNVEFEETPDGVIVRETFDAEGENSADMQRAGWQSILDNFARYVEAKG